MNQNSQQRQEALDSLNLLKSEINLVNFAIHKFNYIPDWLHPELKKNPKYTIKSSQNSIKLVHKENAMDSIIISKSASNGHFIYASVLETFDKGTIVDFVKYRLKDKFSIPGLRKMCKNYKEACAKNLFPDTGIDVKKIFRTGAGTVPNTTQYETHLSPFENKGYLLSRGINVETVNQCASNSYNHYGWRKDETTDRQVISVVFPYYKASDNKLSVYTYQKYNDFEKKFITGSKADSIWVGSFDKTKEPTCFVVSESPIDTLSYVQLNKKTVGENPVLTASGGQFTNDVIDTYSKLMHLSNDPNLVLANDNDCKGQQFNAHILCRLDPKPFLEQEFIEKNPGLLNSDVQCGVSDRKGFLEWSFSHDKLEGSEIDKQIQTIPAFVQVRDHFIQLNKDLVGVNDEKVIFDVKNEFKDNLSKVVVTFNNTTVNWDSINDSLVQLKYNYSENILIEKSICKDWNDDLKLVKGIDVSPLVEDRELLKTFEDKGYLSQDYKKVIEDKIFKLEQNNQVKEHKIKL